MKNRNRSAYTFANINLLGKCNLDCHWCLGKDLPELNQYNCMSTHFSEWHNFDKFLKIAKENKINQLYITGQNTDSLLYKYLSSLISFLRSKAFAVGLRTNGVLALEKMGEINRTTTVLGDAVSLSVLSLDEETHNKITGSSIIPDWSRIIPKITSPLRVSVVIDRYNKDEFLKIIGFLSSFENIRYVQVRRVSTDNRKGELAEDQKAYDRLKHSINHLFPKANEYEGAISYDIFGIECSFWETVNTTANSINYFCNGVISEEYFIVEGYTKNTSGGDDHDI